MKRIALAFALTCSLLTAADYQKTQGDLNLLMSEYRNDAIRLPVQGLEAPKVFGLWIVACTSNKEATPAPFRFVLEYRQAGKVITITQRFATGEYCGNVMVPNVKLADVVNFEVVTKSESFRDMY